jgi:glutaconyl-CoA/methylmalonyl-CoA decarboxylase subunit gamma
VTDRPPRPLPAGTPAALDRLADEILPALIARLDVSGLGELEVRHDGWRVRLRRAPASLATAPASGTAQGAAAPAAEPPRQGATSPGVGYFTPNDRTPVGKKVAAGDVLGWVEVLGVRQEVVAPRDGVVGRYHAEAGQAVEYGQELAAVDGGRRPAADESPAAGVSD